MTAAVIGLALAVAVLAVLVAGVLRSHAEILRALHELGAGLELDSHPARPVPVTIVGVAGPRPVGLAVPDALTGTSLEGETVGFSLQSGATLLAFLSTGCTTCQSFWSTFSTGSPAGPAGARLLVVTRDLDEESESGLRERRPSAVPVVLSTAAWDAFGVPGSPYFLLVRDGAVVGEGSATSWAQVITLLAQADNDAAMTQARARGGQSSRDSRDSAELRAAGIDVGHPSLHEAS